MAKLPFFIKAQVFVSRPHAWRLAFDLLVNPSETGYLFVLIS